MRSITARAATTGGVPTAEAGVPGASAASAVELAECPLCHTAISGASAGYDWRCRTCGQQWSPLRISTVAAYAAWVEARQQSDAPARG